MTVSVIKVYYPMAAQQNATLNLILAYGYFDLKYDSK
jgi:hypothetical protein